MRGGRIDRLIRLDLRLDPALEGGPALDVHGGVIGMAVAGPRRSVLVIPAATVERVAEALATRGRVARGYLGLGLQPVRTPGQASAGLMVMSVDPTGPGAAAGMLQGDLVTAWDDQPPARLRSLLRSLGSESVGRTLRLAGLRAGQPFSAEVTVGERPAA